MTAKTNTQRQQSLRARRAALGLQEVRGIYLPPDRHADLKAYARKIDRARISISTPASC